MLDRRVPGTQVDVVRCESEQPAYELTRLLLEQGHRRISMLSGPADVSTASDRVAGYRRAFAVAGLTAPEDLIFYDAYTTAAGKQMARRALTVTPRPTAFFAANNFIAIGAYHTLMEQGLRVPEDISMVTFDDLPATITLDPFLTVAAQPAEAIGRCATELLLRRLNQTEPAAYQEILLPFSIIVRRSTAPVRVGNGT